jgi:uncharacterized membrane protein YcaP (DUF421 family)
LTRKTEPPVDDKRNLVLAMVLAMLILVGWQYATAYFMPAQEPATKMVDGRSVAVIM